MLENARLVNSQIKISEREAASDSKDDVTFLNEFDLHAELNALKYRARQFHSCLLEMRLSLRFSILALLSEGKVTIFNDSLVEFMGMINKNGWS